MNQDDRATSNQVLPAFSLVLLLFLSGCGNSVERNIEDVVKGGEEAQVYLRENEVTGGQESGVRGCGSGHAGRFMRVSSWGSVHARQCMEVRPNSLRSIATSSTRSSSS